MDLKSLNDLILDEKVDVADDGDGDRETGNGALINCDLSGGSSHRSSLTTNKRRSFNHDKTVSNSNSNQQNQKNHQSDKSK